MQPRKTRKPLIEDERITALNHIGVALLSEHNEQQLLHLIAQTAVDLIGARFAAVKNYAVTPASARRRREVLHRNVVAVLKSGHVGE